MAAMLTVSLVFCTYQYRSALRLQREHRDAKSPRKWVILASDQTHISTPPVKFDLNTVSPETITRELGIDPVIAQRVIEYRQRLGGYVSTRQVEEIKGIDSESAFLLEKHGFISASFTPDKISLSHAARKRISNHPYLAGSTASALTSHLRTHQIRSWNELVNVEGVALEALIKARPYLGLPEGQSISQNL